MELLLISEAGLVRVPGAAWELASIKLFTLFTLRFVGDYAHMRERYDRFELEAQQRGDQYVGSTMRRVCTPMWLAEDDPEGALHDLARASWMPATAKFHVQHFHELVGRSEIALYTGAPEHRAALAEGVERLERSLLLRVHSIRAQYDFVRGRLAVADGDVRLAARLAKRLVAAGTPAARCWAMALRAGIAGPAAAPALEAVAAEAGTLGLRALAAAARHRLGELRGDEAILDEAASSLAALGVRAPARMAAMLVPLAPRRHQLASGDG